MFHTNFDDLEQSLDIMIHAIKKKGLLEEASIAQSSDKSKIELRMQLEDQAKTLSRIKDHYPEIRKDEAWPELEAQAKELLNIRKLFTDEQKTHYEHLKGEVTRLITSKRNEIDADLNERLIERAQQKAQKSQQVKIYKNWTSV